MSEMVDRVEQSLITALRAANVPGAQTWAKGDLKDVARFVLLQMREPTDDMKTAAVPQPDFPVVDEVVVGCRNIAGRYWQAMIDAALKE